MKNPQIPRGEYTNEQSQEILNVVNSLSGEEKICSDEFISTYQGKLFKYCEETDGGKNIGGGCHHVAYAWSITTSVLESAVAACSTPNKPIKRD
ncbi:hypothetical protein [Aliiglaciecola litoralis]